MAFVRRQLLQGDQAGAHHLALVDRQGGFQCVLDDRLDPGVVGGRKGKGVADHLLLCHHGRSRQRRFGGWYQLLPRGPGRARRCRGLGQLLGGDHRIGGGQLMQSLGLGEAVGGALFSSASA